MPSPITLPAGVVGTYCFAMSTGNVSTLLIAVSEISFSASGPSDEEVDHVVRLVVEDRRLAPGALLPTPVRELGGDDGIDVRADL